MELFQIVAVIKPLTQLEVEILSDIINQIITIKRSDYTEVAQPHIDTLIRRNLVIERDGVLFLNQEE